MIAKEAAVTTFSIVSLLLHSYDHSRPAVVEKLRLHGLPANKLRKQKSSDGVLDADNEPYKYTA
jgi:hypothetical protein